MLDFADLRVTILAASFACYLIYKNYEPNRPLPHALLLLVAPSLLVLGTNKDASFLTYCGALLSYWTLVILYTITYRLSPFHPLASYPGPLVARTSKLYHLYLIYRGDAYLVIRSWHEQYGDVVRIGPNELSMCNGDAVPTVLNSRKFKKGPFYDARDVGEGIPIDAIRDLSLHSQRRKPWTRALAPKALKDYDELVKTKANVLVTKMTERVGQEVDLAAWSGYFGYDFMGKLAFDREFHMMDEGGDPNGIWDTLDAGMHFFAILFICPWIAPLLMAIPGSTKITQRIHKIAFAYAEERLASGAQHKDLWYHLTGEDGARNVDLAQVRVDAFTAVIAGSDTTSTALSQLWYLLMRNPECLEKLYDEIASAFPGEERPDDHEQLSNLPYLNACINESMRMFPPTLSGMQRVPEPGSGGAMVGPHYVPEGTAVLVHSFTINRNSDFYYPLPDAFWPDRWLEQDIYTLPDGSTIGKDQRKLDRVAFVPFSTGVQACPGKALAYTEIRCVAATVVKKFKISPAKGYNLDDWEKGLIDAHATIRGSLKANLTLRE